MAEKARSTRASSPASPVSPHVDDTMPAAIPPDEAVSTPSKERYKLGAELGRGGMGRVVEAFDTQLGRTVALKEVLPKGGAGIARRFLREVQITARLEHPAIVPLYDSGTTADGRPFYVMRRVSGRPLDEMFSRMRGLDERLTLLPSVLAAINAIAHAHKRGVIHRDLKPANILVGDLGETVVIDWGLAKVIGEKDDSGESLPTPADSLQTQIGSVFGTPGFMAPEQARGDELGPHSDVYALGATLYQLLAARPPHAGNSASEVLDRTVNNEPVRPLAELAPGAPPELIAIVDKALAYDPNHRYANATALGEDVRRFLSGQLVAAHRYTSRQRVARFAKRHRAPLVVAALAMVSLAVLAWIGVHRIVQERDVADSARELALEQKRETEAANANLVKQVDALTVMRARAMMDANPTNAIAVLKQLSAGSPKLAEAHGIAEAASARGVAWAMQTSDAVPVAIDLSPDTTRLVESSLQDGMIRVFDLEARKLILAKKYNRGVRGIFVANGSRVLVTQQTGRPELLDPATGNVEPLEIPPITYATASDAGDRVVYLDAQRHAGLLDIAKRTALPLWSDHEVHQVEIAVDGSWIALEDGKRAVALDASGNELVHRDGKIALIEISRFRQLAVMDDNKIVITKIDQPAWIEVPIDLPTPHRPMAMSFRGTSLSFYATNLRLYGYDNGHTWEQATLEGFTARPIEAGNGLLIVASTTGKLHFIDNLSAGDIHLPTAMPHLRLAARPGRSRLVAISDGIVMVFELEAVVPKEIDQTGRFDIAWVTDDTLLFYPASDPTWTWYDLKTNTSTDFRPELHGFPMVLAMSFGDGRLLIKDIIGAKNGHDVSRLLLFRRNATTARIIATATDGFGTLVPGDAIVFVAGDNRVMGTIGDEPAHELVKLDSDVSAVASLGMHRYAALSDSGELVIGNVSTGQVEHAHLSLPRGARLESDMAGTPLVIAGNRLMRWEGELLEVARFDKSITRTLPTDGGVIVLLADHEALFVETKPNATPHRLLPPSKFEPRVAGDGSMIVAIDGADQINVVELPAMTRYTLPRLFDSGMFLAVAPSSRRILQGTGSRLAVWTLPAHHADVPQWLEELTNASEDADHIMVWPWQLGGRQPKHP
jgi:hypothetical protein